LDRDRPDPILRCTERLGGRCGPARGRTGVPLQSSKTAKPLERKKRGGDQKKNCEKVQIRSPVFLGCLFNGKK